MKRMTSFLLAIALLAGLILTGVPTVYAASNMRVSEEIVDLLKREEGFCKKPVWDHAQYSVGYGSKCPDDMFDEYMENGITEEEADALLRNYIAVIENSINKKLIDKRGIQLNQNQFDALALFTYNVGDGWMSNTTSILYKAISGGATGSDLLYAMCLWSNASGKIMTGLVRRRLMECNMYLNGVYSSTVPENYCYVLYDANGGSIPYKIQGYDSNEGVAPIYTPTYAGHTFYGWYTAKTGGKKVTKLTKDLSRSTLYARWTDDGESAPAEPFQAVTITVTANDVNLRKGPGTNYGRVGQADKGDKLTITEIASGSGYEWGKAGDVWIALQYTNYSDVINGQQPPSVPETTVPETTVPETTVPETTVPETTVPEQKLQTGTVKVNSRLSIRKGPSTGYACVGYLYNGDKVTILEQKNVGSAVWGRISKGWISLDYVVLDQDQPAAPPVTEPETTVPETTVPEAAVPEATKPADKKLIGTVQVNSRLSVRKGAGTSYAIKSYLYNGAKVTITQVKTVNGVQWGYIGTGWVSMDYVVLNNSTGSESTESVKTVTASCLRVRKTPSTSAEIVWFYYNGAKVTILQTEQVGNTTWGKTDKGWISMDYVK